MRFLQLYLIEGIIYFLVIQLSGNVGVKGHFKKKDRLMKEMAEVKKTEKLNKTDPESVFHLRCIKRDECLCVTVFTPLEYDLPWCGL